MEAVPKGGVPLLRQIPAKRPKEKPILSDEEIAWRLNQIRLGAELFPQEREHFCKVLRKFIHLFAFNCKDMREVTLETHKIELVQNAKAVRQKSYRMNPKYAVVIKIELEKLLEAGFIRPVENTEWVSPISLATKKNGQLRVCVNYKKLNDVTKKDRYPIPFCDEILEEVGGHELYSFADGNSGYHQVKIAKEDQLKTTFTSPWDTFCYEVMSFGLCNAPATFQRLMNKVLELYLGHFVRVFMDDFGIYADSASYLEKLEKVFERLDESEITLSAEKIKNRFSSGRLVGHIVSKGGLGTDPEKIEAILSASFSITKRGIRAFLGITGYYRQFIERYAMIAKPLTKFLKDNAPRPQATPDALEAFEKLKLALFSAPILRTPNWEKPFLGFTDAFGGVGATLAQLDDERFDHPIYYASQQLTSAEMNYTVTEREGLGVIFPLKKFRHYLLGTKVTVVTDHQTLVYLLNKPSATGRIARWIIML